MKSAIMRILLVGVCYFLLMEVRHQVSVSLRESTGELLGMWVHLLLIVGLVWASLPAFGRVGNLPIRVSSTALVIVLLFVGLHTANYYYSWHVRPNIGLYREPYWVADHPGFQKELRASIEANRW